MEAARPRFIVITLSCGDEDDVRKEWCIEDNNSNRCRSFIPWVNNHHEQIISKRRQSYFALNMLHRIMDGKSSNDTPPRAKV